MTPSQSEELISAACHAQEGAYAPFSNYLVGAAVRTLKGTIYSGCNIENTSYSLTICAERVAIASAIAAGERKFEALAVATKDGATPCGACLQFLAEFSSDLPILVVTIADKPVIRQHRLVKLLPQQFHRKK